MNLQYLRAKLDRLNEQIVSRIKDRSRFVINEAVYRPGAIPIRNQNAVSLMEWALTGMERYHATLGRYELPDQLPLRNDVITESPVQRRVDMPLLPVITPPPRDELVLGLRLIRLRRQFLRPGHRSCPPVVVLIP